MKLQTRQIIFIVSILVTTWLVKMTSTKAHENKFHIPQTININRDTSNSTQIQDNNQPEKYITPSKLTEFNSKHQAINSRNSSNTENLNLIIKPE